MILHPDLPYVPLPYVERLESRPPGAITLAVIHCTELPDLATAREYGEIVRYAGSETGNSGHFYIDRDGSVQQWVPLERIAHHVRGHNANSVGIELVNRGRYPDWWDTTSQDQVEPFEEAQVEALIALLRFLHGGLPALRRITGHEQLDQTRIAATDDASRTVRRKRDPGPGFPWDRVIERSGLPWWDGAPAPSEERPDAS
jgi:N-acetylmuramoyl-L-alanine amidase